MYLRWPLLRRGVANVWATFSRQSVAWFERRRSSFLVFIAVGCGPRFEVRVGVRVFVYMCVYSI